MGYKATVGSDGQMVNVGDFVHYTDSTESLVRFSNGYFSISSCIYYLDASGRLSKLSK